MAQRLVRAKKKIQAAAIPYRVPLASLLPERLSGVLAVLYLLFNEGYRASSGADLVRPELSAEAIGLARLLLTLQPGEPEAAGLLALMLLNDSRRGARTGASGDLVPLPDQDRTRWDRTQSTKGCACWQLRPTGRSLACTSRRPRSPPATPAPPAPRTPTGPPSPGCTRSLPFCCPPRWWNATAPSPWAWPTVPPRASPSPTTWPPAANCPATIFSRRFAPIPAPPRAPGRGSGRLPHGHRAGRHRFRAPLPGNPPHRSLGRVIPRCAATRRG